MLKDFGNVSKWLWQFQYDDIFMQVTTFCRERKRRGIGLRVSQNPVLLKCVETAQNLERRCCQFGDVTLYSRQNYTPNYSSRQNLMDTTTPPDYLLQLQNTPNTQHHSNPHAHAPWRPIPSTSTFTAHFHNYFYSFILITPSRLQDSIAVPSRPT